MPSYRQDPTGGYVIRRDDGTEFRSAIPVGMPQAPSGPAPMQLDPSIAQAATAPQPDNRLAMNDPGPAAQAQVARDANSGIWQGIKNFGSRIGDSMDEARMREAARGNFSGIDNVDRAAFEAAKARGLVAPQASPGSAAVPRPTLQLPDQVMTDQAPGQGGGPQAGQAPGGAVFATQQPQAPPGGLPPGYYKTTAGYVPRAKSEQVRDIPEEQRKQIDYAFQSQAAAQQYGGAVGAAKAAEQYGAQQGYIQQMRELEAQEQLREQKRQQAIQAQMDKVQSTAQDVASQKIDRNHVWASGGRDAAAIAMAIGAFVQARGGPNTVAPLINKAIDDDLKEQEVNLQNKREGLQAQNNILGQMRQQFGDERSAYLAAKAIKTDDLARQIELTAARYKAPEVAAQAQLSVAELRKQYAALMTELHGTTSAISSVYDPGGIHGGPGKPNEADVKHLDTELRKEKIPDAYASLADADRIMDKSRGDDIPGLGKAKSWAVEHLPGAESALSDEGMANRQAVERAAVAVAHATGRVNENEVALIKKHMMGDGSVRAIRNGLAWGRAQLQNIDRSVRASVPGAAQAEYVRRGGLPMPDYRGNTQVTPAGEGQ